VLFTQQFHDVIEKCSSFSFGDLRQFAVLDCDWIATMPRVRFPDIAMDAGDNKLLPVGKEL
jgi:hypothetical protein